MELQLSLHVPIGHCFIMAFNTLSNFKEYAVEYSKEIEKTMRISFCNFITHII